MDQDDLELETIHVVDDDDQAVWKSLRERLGSLGTRLETHPSAEEFLSRGADRQPGCAVIEVRLSGMSGQALLREMRERGSELPMIVVTAQPDVRTVVEVMQLGAIALLEKPPCDQDLQQAVVKGLELDRVRRFRRRAREEFRRRRATLNDGEVAVMQMLMRGDLNKTVARALDISIRTVDLRRRSILEKMGVTTIHELIWLAAQNALSNPSDSHPAPTSSAQRLPKSNDFRTPS